MKRFVKGGIVAIVFLAVVICVFIIGVLYFSQDKVLRGYVDKYSSEYTTADVNVGEYDLSVFKHFPHITLCVSQLQVLKDSSDVLLCADKFDVAINVWALLAGKVSLAGVYIDSLRTSYCVDSLGAFNWDIIKLTDTIQSADTLQTDSFIKSIGVKQLKVRNASLFYKDDISGKQASLNGLSLDLRGGMAYGRGMLLDVNLIADTLSYAENDQEIIKDVRLGLNSMVIIKTDSNMLRLRNANVLIDKMSFSGDGYMKKDTVNDGTYLDFTYSLDIPSFKEGSEIIPDGFEEYTKDLQISGNMSCAGSLKGLISRDSMPFLKTVLSIDDVSISHPKLAGVIDTLDVQAELNLDLSGKGEEKLELTDLYMVATGLVFNADGTISNILHDPQFDILLNTSVDIAEVAKFLPDTIGVSAEGNMNGDIRAIFALSDITNGNFGNIRARGIMEIPIVDIDIPDDSICIKINSGSLSLGSSKTGIKDAKPLLANKSGNPGRKRSGNRKSSVADSLISSRLNGRLSYESFKASLGKNKRFESDSMRISFSTSQVKDSNTIVPLNASLMWQNFAMIERDTVVLMSSFLKVSARIKPWEKNRTLPFVNLTISADTLSVKHLKDRLSLGSFELQIAAPCLDVKKHIWLPDGHISVTNLSLFTPFFPLRLGVKNSRFDFDKDNLTMHDANFSVGRSRMKISGDVLNIWRGIWEKDSVITGKITMDASRINFNQILLALDRGSAFKASLDSMRIARDSTSIEVNHMQDSIMSTMDVDADSTISLSRVYVLPSKYELYCKISVNKLVLGKWNMDDVYADLDLKKGTLKMNEMKLNSSAADIHAMGLYYAEDSLKAYAGFAMKMNDVQVDTLLGMFPQFDTIFPMLQSFAGNMNVNFAVAGNWDSNMDVDMNSIKGAACIDGKNLILMDGETFSYIAKKLRFKNRERNLIDSVSMSMTVSDGIVNIFPFILDMDRYKAAIGGKQNLDMTFRYQISILDSPLPFKFGLDVYGDVDNMKFRITKAKYKDILKPAKKAGIDSIRVNIQSKIMNFLDEIREHNYNIKIKSSELDSLDMDTTGDAELEKAINEFQDE